MLTIDEKEDRDEKSWLERYKEYSIKSKLNDRQKELLERAKGNSVISRILQLRGYERCRIPSKNIVEELDHIVICIRENGKGYIGKMTNINEGQYIIRRFHYGGNVLGSPVGTIKEEQRKELEQVGIIERKRRTRGNRDEKESIIYMNKYQLKKYK